MFRWGAVALLMAACLGVGRPPLNALTLLVASLSALMLVSAAFLTPVYASQGLYRPLILLFGFLAVSGMNSVQRKQLFVAGLAITLAMAVAGLLQHVAFLLEILDVSRADGLFLTPNSYAAALNLLLLPATALYVIGHRRYIALPFCIFLCFAALVASASRGGLLSFAAGLVFLAAVLVAGKSRDSGVFRRIGLLISGWAVCWLIVRTLPGLAPGTGTPGGVLRDLAHPSATMGRMEIYQVVLELIWQKPLSGWGANTFHALFEASKSDAWGATTFSFVHNDYLQMWLEYGMAGLLVLAAVIAAAFGYVYRTIGSDSQGEGVAAGAALTAVFTHAVVDYPLFLHYSILLVACMLGAIAALRGSTIAQAFVAFTDRASAAFTPVMRVSLALLVLAWFSQPMLAEQASRSSLLALQRSDLSGALYWASVARRLEPKGSDHYWAEGVILREYAIASNDRRYADEADARFAQAAQANPYDVNAYIARARLHRANRALLSKPADPDTILEWTSNALAARPVSPMTRSEQVRSLVAAGRSEEASRILSGMLTIPEQEAAGRNLAAELGIRP